MAEYCPQLRYVFNLPVLSPIQQHLAVMRYLNEAGQTPRILAGEPAIFEELQKQKIRFCGLDALPNDYDVMLSLGVGYDPFERYWLEKSMEAGKVNLEFVHVPCPSNFVNLFDVPRRTKFLHGVCVPDARTMENCRAYNREVLYLLTGLPAWDRFRTETFRQEAEQLRMRLGPRLLVIGVSCAVIDKEAAYYRQVIPVAETAGFKVILQVHPGREHLLPKDLMPHRNPGLDRFILFAAASHVIGFVHSAMISENLFLGKTVGCKPLANSYDWWDETQWLDDPAEWHRWAQPLFGSDYLSMLPLIHDGKTLAEFLARPHSAVLRRRWLKMLGYPKVPSFTEHALRTLDVYFGKDNAHNVQLILKKNAASRGLLIDYSFWDVRKDWNQFRGVSDLPGFLNAGVSLMRQGRFADAHRYLARAEMYSGTEHFAFVQYMKALCQLELKRFNEAQTSIYRALIVQPDRREFQQLKYQIHSLKQTGCSVCRAHYTAPAQEATV